MNKRRVALIIEMVVLVFADLALGGIVQVDCTKPDQTLTRALQTAQPGDTIRVTGTCTETITITTDDVTIEGHDNAVVDGQGTKQNVITINGARRVTIKQVTVQRGNNGIYAQRGASVILDGVIAQDNADDGIEIGQNASAQIANTTAVRNADDGIEADQGATVELKDCTAKENGDDGLIAQNNASIALTGTNTSTNNGDEGVKLVLSASGSFSGTVVLDHNKDNGMAISMSASGIIAGATLSTNHNGVNGIQLVVGGSIVIVGKMIDSKGNGRDGIFLGTNGSLAAIGSAILRIEDNQGNGVASKDGGSVLTTGKTQLTARNNKQAGVVVFSNASGTFLGAVIAEGNPAGDQVTKNAKE